MDDNLNKKIEITNKKSVEIGADTNGDFINTLIDGAQVGMLDISSIDALSQSAQSRERTYELIDSMASDPIISAILETYAEDSVETNDEGETVWIESQDVHVLDFTS